MSWIMVVAASAAVFLGFLLLGLGRENEDWIALALGVFLLLLGCAAMFDEAAAQPIDAAEVVRSVQAPRREPRAPRRVPAFIRQTEPVRVLAIMAWAESGAHVTLEEVAALREVIATRAQRYGVSFQHHAWQYSAGLRNPRYRFLLRLDPEAVPATFPAYVRTEWPRVMAAAEAAYAGGVDHGCGAKVTHFGGPSVDAASIARLVRRGYRVADCPAHFHNAYLTRIRR